MSTSRTAYVATEDNLDNLDKIYQIYDSVARQHAKQAEHYQSLRDATRENIVAVEKKLRELKGSPSELADD